MPNLSSKINSVSLALIQSILTDGSLRIAFPDEPISRVCQLDDVSIPSFNSPNSDERQAAETAKEVLEHLLLGKLVLVHVVRHSPVLDRLVVRIYSPKDHTVLAPGSKMPDTF
jgi:hypothetical protein